MDPTMTNLWVILSVKFVLKKAISFKKWYDPRHRSVTFENDPEFAITCRCVIVEWSTIRICCNSLERLRSSSFIYAEFVIMF